jgi:hypothetical protein
MAVEETIKIKIQANAEEFKIVSDIINRELGRLGKNFEVLEGNIKQSSNAMKGFDGSSKKFNKGLMSISLILQDLPYGFRGIQNNIPALVQGMGVLYLAISAVTAAMTYFVLQGDKMSKGTKEIFESFKSFANGVASDLYNTLKPAFDSIVKSIMFLWDMFGKNLINAFKYTWENLLAFLKIAGNILAEAFNLVTSVIKGDWSKFGESLLNIFKYAWNAIVQFLSFSLKMVGNAIGAFTRIFNKDLGDAITKSTEYTANKFSDSFKFAFKEVQTSSEKIDIFKLFKKDLKNVEKPVSDFQKTMNSLNEEMGKLNVLFVQFRQMSKLDFLEGQIRALNVAIDDLAGQKTDAALKKLAELIQLRGELLLQQKVGEAMQNIGGDIEVITEPVNKPVFDKNTFNAGKEQLEGWFKSVKDKFKEMQKMAKESQEYLLKIGIGMMSALGPSIDMLLEKGASIGDVLSNAFNDLIKKLAKVAIAAAIVVALMALIGLVDLSQIGKTFGMLVGQGMGMGAGLFAGAGNATSAIAPTSSASLGNLTSVAASQNQTLVAQVSGNDLLVLLNRTSRNNNNTF